MSDTTQPTLAELRQSIDDVDSTLLELLNKRATISLNIGALKAQTPGTPVYDPKREHALLQSLEERNPGPLPADHIRTIWREIMASSRLLQRPRSVAYLGPEGTFSYFAGIEFLGQATSFQPCTHLHQVFYDVYSGNCDLGIVPLENSLQGTVGQSFDLFSLYPVHIQAEFLSRIRHCLLSRESSLFAIRNVYSHPQPLAQCGRWLRANLPQANLIPVESTAAAAYRAAEEPGAASIGHRKLGEKMLMNILSFGIEDDPVNWTRFVIITAQEPGNTPLVSDANKTSLLFTLQDKSGALSAILGILANYQINMRKLESRPMPGECWKYIFFADVECDLKSPAYEATVRELRESCTSFRILGSYPAATDYDTSSGKEARS